MGKYELSDSNLDDLIEIANAMNVHSHKTELKWYQEGFQAGIHAAYRFIEEEG